MASVTREELVAYCKEDDDIAGDALVSLADAAEDYLRAAGVTDVLSDRYKLCVKALTLHWHDHPTGGDLPTGLQRIINQLKHS